MKAELERRSSRTDLIEALFRSRPNVWIPMQDLAIVGGLGGWRTRCSECHTKRGMRIEWNGLNGLRSAHRFVPYVPLARSAETYVEQKSLFELR